MNEEHKLAYDSGHEPDRIIHQLSISSFSSQLVPNTYEEHFYNKILTDQSTLFNSKHIASQQINSETAKSHEYHVKMREKNRFEQAEDMPDARFDQAMVKSLYRLYLSFSQVCSLIISTPAFEFFIILVILLNTLTMALEDPQTTQQDSVLQQLDLWYLYIYSFEAFLKIGGTGLILDKNSYLRDSWNVMDFIIVVTAWVERIAQEGVNLNALRTLRVLRPLRSISSIEGLRILIVAIISSIKPLLLSMLVFLFFLSIFAIGGLQLWMGAFRKRCMNLSSGIFQSDELCGECPIFSECVSSLDNPNYGSTNFDDFLHSLLVVFQCVTLEGWTGIMYYSQSFSSIYIFFFYVPLVFIGAFLLLNFTLAVIKSSFTKAMNEVRGRAKEQDTEEVDLNTSIVQENLTKRGSEVEFCTFRTLNDDEDNRPTFRKFPRGREIGSLISEDISPPSSSIRRLSRISDRVSRFSDKFSRRTQRYQTRNKDSLLSLMTQRGGNLRVTKAMVTKLKFNKKLKKLVYTIPEDGFLESDSTCDVLPPNSHLQQTKDSSIGFEYVYSSALEEILPYKLKGNKEYTSRILEAPSKFKMFRLIAFQKKFSVAFGLVQGYAQQTITQIQDLDKTCLHTKGVWSALDVNENFVRASDYYIARLSLMDIRLWSKGFSGVMQRARHPFRLLSMHWLFIDSMTLAVVLNTVVLALDHHGISEDFETSLNTLNIIFSCIFLGELVIKLVGLGVVGYFKDIMNYLDAAVAVLSCIEIAFLSGNSAFTAFRTFRIFRVLRVARLFRYMRSMVTILKVLSSSISNFIYLALLLLLFTLIFALLGMQIFGGKFDFEDGTPRANFDDFNSAFVTVFQILSLENWQTILYDGMRSSAGQSSVLFFISWILLGNFILLNLFLAILLDSFSHNDEDEALNKNKVSTEVEENFFMDNHQPRRESFFNRLVMRKRRQSKENIMSQLHLMAEESEEESKSLEELRKLKTQTTRKPLFHEVFCLHSFYCFSQENKFRITCYKIANSMAFERAILLLICLTSVKLVWDSYLLEEPSGSVILEISWYLDIGLTVCFFVEFLIKSISMGFFIDPNSYLRDYWNQIDFMIIIVSVLELTIQSIDLPYIKVIRLLRTLRPLRFISHNFSMKLVVTALLESLFAILNVVFVLLIIWLMFAILGVSLFGGKFYSCENSAIRTQSLCEAYGFKWKNADSNFDNVIEAMITLFIISSLEGWPNIMYQAIDGTESDTAPERDHNPAAAYYFIIFIFIGAFFFINFFIGVVFMKFDLAKKNESSVYSAIMTKKQLKWLEMQELIVNAKPHIEIVKPPDNFIRRVFYTISKHFAFESSILCCILLNMLVMAMPYEGAPEDYFEVLELLNIGFTIIFAIECIIKLTGLGCKVYFTSKWNRFDFVVVLGSFFEIYSKHLVEPNDFLLQGPQFARIIRILRVCRLVRVFKDLKSLQDLIAIMGYSLKAILNVLSLLVLLFFIYAILGVFIFNSVPDSDIINEYNNFNNFGMAMITLFRVSTGEDWQLIMYECSAEVGLAVSAVYFLSFTVITMFVMLNLFIMVIVQTYEDYEKDPKNTLQLFTSDVKKFKKAWAFYAHSHGGCKIDYRRLPDLLWTLGELDDKLGYQKEIGFSKTIKLLSTMDIYIDELGFVYFNDMLYVVLQKRYANMKAQDLLVKKILKKEDIATGRKLNKIRTKCQVFSDYSEKIQPPRLHNLFITMIYAKTVLRVWKNWAKQRAVFGSSGNITPQDSDLEFPGHNSFIVDYTQDLVLNELS